MEKAVVIKNLFFTYGSRKEATLKNINLEIPFGQFVLITGATGCGKSTVLKTLNGIIPHESSGTMEGTVEVMGLDSQTSTISQLAQQVGLVFQSPDEQIFSTVVEDEVAFGVENLGLNRKVMGERITQALEAVKMQAFRHAQTNALSGGQKQRVAVASLQAMQPKILALDEPISQLDPQGAEEVLNILKDLKEQLGITIILVEHRIHEVAHLIDRLIIMEEGQIVLDQPVKEAFSQVEVFQRCGLRLPETVQISHSLGINPPFLNLEEAACGLSNCIKEPYVLEEKQEECCNHDHSAKEEIVRVEGLSFTYQKGKEMTLKNLSLRIEKGEKIALMGNNGAGKSTLLQHLMALFKPTEGMIQVLGQDTKKIDAYSLAGKVGMVFQNPDLMLFCDTVEKEIEFGLKNLAFSPEVIQERKRKVLKTMGLEDLKDDFPLALSRGQRLRVAIAAVLALEPQLLILDEPTTGQDKAHLEEMMEQLEAFNQKGGTLIFCTHDVETALRYAERSIIMHQGRILADGCPKQAFSDLNILQTAGLKPPPSLYLSRKLGLPLAFSVEEVLVLVQGPDGNGYRQYVTA